MKEKQRKANISSWHLIAHCWLTQTCSLTKKFWILLCQDVRAQKLIHDTDSFTLKPATVLPRFPLSCVWNSAIIPMFYKLQTCSDNAGSVNFLFKYLLATPHTLNFTFFASTLLRISFAVLFFLFVFRHSFL